AVCINQTDPNLPACHPPTGLQNLFVNPPKLAGAVPGSLDGPACGNFVAIPLPLNNGTQPAMVRLSANATAATGISPRRDRDTFLPKCLPPTTPCQPVGCFDGLGSAFDLLVTGPITTTGVGSFFRSTDGTCSGESAGTTEINVAADQAAAGAPMWGPGAAGRLNGLCPALPNKRTDL